MKLQDILNQTQINTVARLIISNPKTKIQEYTKVVMRPVVLKQHKRYQLELFTKTQAFHENHEETSIIQRLLKLSNEFKQMDIFTQDQTIQIKMKDINDIYVSQRKTEIVRNMNPSLHNRTKQYLLAEGDIIPSLVDQGIFTKEGKIVASKYDKYKQINRFIEMIDDVIRKQDIEELNIVDFGCGKSYLTFILYHYLVSIKKIKTTITGLDLKSEVIDECNQIALRYEYDGLTFQQGDIAHYHSDKPVDMVISLHACDTATDLALYHAIQWGTKMIFSVPCCQHELNAKVHTNQFSLFEKYGIIKERMSALMTDAMRGQLLEICGYDVNLLEFIDVVHSPKNILIRAIKKNQPVQNKQKLLDQLKQVEREFNAELTLHQLLKQQITEIE